MVRWRIPYGAIAAIAALTGCSNPVADTVTHSSASPAQGWRIAPAGTLNDFFDCLDDAGVALVAAHRGGPAKGFPENSVETMEALLTKAPALMEIDVATSADGVLYLMHDDTLSRTTNGDGATQSLPWDAIEKLRLEDNDGRRTDFRPSRFDEALAWAEGRTILEIDFKRTTRFEDVVDEIHRQHAQNRVILIAYSAGAAAKLHRLAPEIMIALNIDSQSALNGAVAKGVPDRRLLGFTGLDQPRPRLFSALEGRNVEVIFGTLGGRDSLDRQIAQNGDDALYARLAAQGVDIIATDRPREAFAALKTASRAPWPGQCGVSYHNPDASEPPSNHR